MQGFSLLLATLINICLIWHHKFHKILYTVLNTLIGYKFGDLWLQIRITVEIKAVNYLYSFGGFLLMLENIQ